MRPLRVGYNKSKRIFLIERENEFTNNFDLSRKFHSWFELSLIFILITLLIK